MAPDPPLFKPSNPHPKPRSRGRVSTGWRQFGQGLTQAVRWLGHCLLQPLNWLRHLQRRDRLFALILMGVWLSILLGNFFLKGNLVFEGNLVAKAISFTYAGQEEKLFLQPMRNLQTLDIQGAQPQPLVLTGRFSSPDAAIQQKLSQLNKLTLSLSSPMSRLVMESSKPGVNNQLSILELRLYPNTQVSQLTYDFSRSELSFCVLTESLPAKTCLFPDNSLPGSSSSQPPVGKVILALGQTPLSLNLERVSIPELSITADGNDILPEISFTPELGEPGVELLSPTQLYIRMAATPTIGEPQASNALDYIRADIEVKNVQFIGLDPSTNINDELQVSTLLDGEIRMGSQTMKLNPDQFLIIPTNQPGISRLRYIRLNPTTPKGLKILISGKSNSIATGLYPDYPVQKIEPSFLSKYFSQEAINAILAFIGAFTAVLLPRLFPDPTNQNHNSNQ